MKKLISILACLIVAGPVVSYGKTPLSAERLRNEILALQGRIKNEQKEIQETKDQMARLQDKVDMALDIQKSITKTMEFRRVALEKSSKLESELKERKVLLDAYKKAFVSKSGLKPNQKLGDVELKNGDSYTGVTFKRLEGSTVHLAHSGGFATVDLHDLPDELAGHFKLPPAYASSGVDVQSLILSKPDAMKSSRQQLDDYYKESDLRQEKYKSEREKLIAESRAKQDAEIARRKKLASERQQLQEKIAPLEATLSQIRRAISAQTSAKRDYEWDAKYGNGNVRKSAADIAKGVAAYDAKINALSAQQAQLEAQIKVLKSKIQY